MIYEDFVIEISSALEDGFKAHVVQSPAGEGVDFFRLPFPIERLGALLNTMAQTMGSTRNVTVERMREFEPMTPEFAGMTPRQLGDALFKALFSGVVLSLYDRSLGRVESRSDVGLRIKIKIDPNQAKMERLHSVPWEVLHRRSTQEFLGLSRLSPVVRYLEVPRPVPAVSLPNPLRILVVLSSPSDMDGLDLERERQNLQKVWSGDRRVEIQVLKAARLDGLRAALLERPFHVLHYMGHGGYRESDQTGMLFFQRSDGNSELVSGANLATNLSDFRTLRLVFLNACNSAKATGDSGLNPFSGVATALVMGGIPAVLAMQFPISDAAAITFSKTFYRRLALGDPVDTAVVEGRLAVRSQEEYTSEWGTPVLFSRMAGGALFETPPKGFSETSDQEKTPVSPKSEKGASRKIYAILMAFFCLVTWLGVVYWEPIRTALVAEIGVPKDDEAKNRGSDQTQLSALGTPGKNKTSSDRPAVEKETRDTTSPREIVPAGTLKSFSLADGVNIKMVWVPGGSFTMGSPSTESGRSGDETWHKVTLSQGFWMGRTEITQTQWRAIMGSNPSEFQGDDLPVENVSWPMVEDFLFKANMERSRKDQFRLPTEAEWEYACRAGTAGAFAGEGDAMAWHRLNSARKTHPVGQKESNPWGLFDMHGNVWEWCEDWKTRYSREPTKDPRGPSSGRSKVIRGGSWDKELHFCRSANRHFVGPSSKGNEIGFRLVQEPH